MRRILLNGLICAAISAIAVFGADNSIGTWKRNIAKSSATPPPANPVTSLTLTYEPADGGSKLTATGERKDGTKINSTSTVKYDGKPYPVSGATWDTTAMKQVDANTFTFESKKTGGKYHITGRTVISKDGKTMTTTTKGTNTEGQPFSSKAIYDKQ